jgi:hypothetical protein
VLQLSSGPFKTAFFGKEQGYFNATGQGKATDEAQQTSRGLSAPESEWLKQFLDNEVQYFNQY